MIYIFLSYWSMGLYGNLQTSQALSYSPQTNGITLMLDKTLSFYIIENIKTGS